ncbi:uncharacterized protein L3040_002257 [Drepanopeziza brunnea f. sp. 'multigermtubi']|uniref:Uncharacterized protein n=1 Tax=Marssonina brunnea f. sp. multigermtubi (strain MB_m1) TaxID=1072389 RepID=K1WR08_MARBU|nr:uncharacterized protein MBM_02017 [Drepanopeziza brunnea f. sp. 'multigermtubi' MB_m1]EKD20065.1 hypothetical protein MBM_02017 [Drepanopeziza brunnea f. sp. 'multigermtubi' MB_m1]KAJ5050374.1 hypothetical protein L3040_002257 [Drepanopeziza brunnea f. sp. 'multigermtubi']
MSFFENFCAFLASAASAGMRAARETLIPSLAEGSKAAAEKIGHAVSAESGLSKENLGRALAGAGQAVNSFAQNHVGPAVGGAAVALERMF